MAEANLGPLALKRWPHRRGDPLLPFDAADRYLLKQLDEHRRGPATLVPNDQCGALWLPAAATGPGTRARAGAVVASAVRFDESTLL